MSPALPQRSADDPSPQTWPELLAAFEDALYRKGRSASTISGYTSSLRGFATYHEETTATSRLYVSRLSAGQLSQYMKFLGSERRLSAATLNRAASALREFSRFLLKQGWHREDIGKDLTHRRTRGSSSPKRLAAAQLAALRAAVDLTSLTGERDLAIIEVILACGARVSELVELNIGDVEFSDGTIRLGIRDRRAVPLGDRAAICLQNYVRSRGQLRPNSPLFAARNGARIASVTVQHLVKKYLSIGGMNSYSARDLQNHFVAKTLDSQSDLEEARRLIGHQNIRSTLRVARNKSK